MISCAKLAVVVDHVNEFSGQKKLAKGCDGKWYVWRYIGNGPYRITKHKTEATALKAYNAIVLPKSVLKYDSWPVPHLVNVNDKFFSSITRVESHYQEKTHG